MNIKKRNSSIELLRIISMIMIIVSHCSVHGLKELNSTIFINNIIRDIFTLGNLGVTIFVIITGYVSYGKNIKISKIIKLEFQVIFYSLILYIISSIIMHTNILSIDLVKSIFPIIFKKYWFISAYIILYLFVPYINMIIDKFDNDILKKLIITNIVLVFIIPTITTSDLFFNELFQFISFYLVGAYIKKYNINVINKKKQINILMICICIFLISSTIIIEFISFKFQFLKPYSTYFFNRNSIFILMLAICIFLEFISIEEYNCNIINNISSTTLGIYLIHDNPNFRSILWNNINLEKYFNKTYFILIILLTVIIIFIVCFVIEFIRKNIIEKLIDKSIFKIK